MSTYGAPWVRYLFWTASVYAVGSSLWHLFWAFACSGWKAVSAKVLACQIEGSRDDNRWLYTPKLKYEFLVSGKQFTSERLSFHPFPVSSYEKLSEELSGVVAGRTVTAYYDPGSPHRAVLIRGPRADNFVLVGFCLFFAYVCFFRIH